MKRKWLSMLIAVASALLSQAASAAERKPNIVFLLADDLGWTGLRCFGSDYYETPNLDRLADQGVRFTDAYAACTVCSPTRASIMTGVYPAKLRLTDFIAGQNRPWAKMKIPDWNKGLRARQVTTAEALNDAGYRTGFVGKWHLDAPRGEPESRGPLRHGFDQQFVKPKGTRGYFLPKGGNPDGESKSEYVTDYLTDKALSFIDESKSQPFFLYFAYHTPHTPIQGRADLVERFEKKRNPRATHKNPIYAAMVASLDQSVGRILERLDKHGLSERTVVVFTSDNGGLTQRNGKHDGFTENLPLRRGKGSAYEGGVRVPTIIRWPGVAPKGKTCRSPIISVDYYPTLLEIAGASGDVKHNATLDGQSVVPLLREPAATIDRDLFWHYPHYHAGGDGPYSAIRSGGWRLIEFHEDKRLELYDLGEDVGEQNDLSGKNPQQAERLHKRLQAWRDEVAAQMPTPNPNYDPKRATEVKRRR